MTEQAFIEIMSQAELETIAGDINPDPTLRTGETPDKGAGCSSQVLRPAVAVATQLRG